MTRFSKHFVGHGPLATPMDPHPLCLWTHTPFANGPTPPSPIDVFALSVTFCVQCSFATNPVCERFMSCPGRVNDVGVKWSGSFESMRLNELSLLSEPYPRDYWPKLLRSTDQQCCYFRISNCSTNGVQWCVQYLFLFRPFVFLPTVTSQIIVDVASRVRIIARGTRIRVEILTSNMYSPQEVGLLESRDRGFDEKLVYFCDYT